MRELLPLFAAVLCGCGADIFHATDWETLCDKDPSAETCASGVGGGGGGGAGGAGSGGADAGACLPCLKLVNAAIPAPLPEAICPTSRDIYELLQVCRCGMGGACLAGCMDSPACGGVSATSAETCNDCAKHSCVELVEACAAVVGP